MGLAASCLSAFNHDFIEIMRWINNHHIILLMLHLGVATWDDRDKMIKCAVWSHLSTTSGFSKAWQSCWICWIPLKSKSRNLWTNCCRQMHGGGTVTQHNLDPSHLEYTTFLWGRRKSRQTAAAKAKVEQVSSVSRSSRRFFWRLCICCVEAWISRKCHFDESFQIFSDVGYQFDYWSSTFYFALVLTQQILLKRCVPSGSISDLNLYPL